MKIIAISGSLRKDSFNTSMLKVAQLNAPDGMDIEIFNISSIPFFNADVEAQGLPESVRSLKTLIAESDGILISTPEYNSMISAVLQNTLEWVSRNDAVGAVAVDKPLAIMGVTPGGFGAVKAISHLLHLAVILRMGVNAQITLPIAKANKLLDSEGNLTDAHTLDKLTKFLEIFQTFISSS